MDAPFFLQEQDYANYNCTLEHDCEDEPYLKKLIIAPSSSEVQEAMIISLQELGWDKREEINNNKAM